jgi:hypothetical protein
MSKLVSKLRESKPPKKSPASGHIDLEKRIEYAINCIEADMPSKQKAADFLHKARQHLDNPELLSKLDKVLSDGT